MNHSIHITAEKKSKIEEVIFDVKKIRSEFPILKQRVYDKPLVYLDNAATTQKPQSVLDAIEKFYTQYNSNIHRGIHCLSEQATQAYEDARVKVKNFLNASSEKEIIFTRGATEAINLVASSFGASRVGEGDEIIISAMEHHSNIVPWQILCENKKAKLRIIPMNDAGELILDEFEKLLNEKTKLVSIVHISNSLGTINPVKKIIEMAHSRKVPVVIDGAQAVKHTKTDVQDLDCDFYVFSGHKIYAPTGIGVLYGKYNLLEKMPPYQSGGDMIKSVTFEKTIYNDLPYKFEAGTSHISGGIGLRAAIDFVNEISLDVISKYEDELLDYATEKLSQIPEVKIIGTAKNKAGVISFVINEIHPHDIGTVLDREGVAIRTGHHCTQPVMERFGIPATCRASFAIYNTKEEIDALVKAIHKAIKILG